MNRRLELLLITILLLLAAALRTWDLSHLPPGFTDDELAHIRITETARQGDVAVHYQVGDGTGHTGMYGIGNALVTELTGDGLLGYRVFPLWGGLLTLAALYLLTRRLFGPGAALIALGLMSVSPRAVLLARTATPAAFVPGLTVLTLYLLTKAFHLRRAIAFRAPDTVPFTLLAMLLGLSGYLHYTALALGPLAALFFAHLLVTRQPISRRTISAMLFVIVLATVVALPYLISTLRDPQSSEPYTLWAQRPDNVLDALDGTLRAIGGLIWRGDPDPAHNLPELPVAGPGMAILLLIGAGAAIQGWRDPRHALLLLPLVAGLLFDAWIEPETTFTANLVAQPAVYVLATVGLLAVGRALAARGMGRAWQPVTVLLVTLMIVNGLVVHARLLDDFTEDEAVAAAYHADLGRLAAYLDRTPGDLPVSLCIAGMNEPGPVGLAPRQALGLMLHREDLGIRHSDCRTALVFVNAGAPMRFIFAHPEDRELMPPELAEWLVDAPPLAADELPEGTVLYLDVEQRIRDLGGFWDSRAPAYYMPGEDGRLRRATLPAQLEQNLTFAGYDPRLYASNPEAGGPPIVLVSYWRVDGPLPTDLSVFAHLLAHPNPQLAPVAESNTLDVIPSELQNRDLFAQVSYIWVGEAVPPGEYSLTIGAYTGAVAVLENHLDVLDPRQAYRPSGDRILLGRVLVEAPDDTQTPPEETAPEDTPPEDVPPDDASRDDAEASEATNPATFFNNRD